MKKGKKPSHKAHIAALVLLAAVCIGGAELLACYHFAPALYQRLTAPVLGLVQSAADSGSRLVQSAAGWLASLRPEPDGLETSLAQVAGGPALVSDAPLADPSLTELKQAGGLDILTGGIIEIVYYNQADAAWADGPYGADDIGRYGCGPVTMSMAVSSMTGHKVDPLEMASLAYEAGHWARKSGSYLSIVEDLAQRFGLSAAPIQQRTVQAVQDALLAGDLLVALMGPGHFTSGGHFILLRGVTLSGGILVADPNSRDRSLTVWDPQTILDELSGSTRNGAPLWTLSAPSP